MREKISKSFADRDIDSAIDRHYILGKYYTRYRGVPSCASSKSQKDNVLRYPSLQTVIDKNVVKGVERFKVPEKPPRFLSLQEIGQLLDAAMGSYIYPLIVTALHTGMRKSELLNLKWSDVDFEQNTVTIQSDADWHTKNYKSKGS